MQVLRRVVLFIGMLSAASAAWAQAAVTAADVTRLELTAGDIERQVSSLQKSDPSLSADVGRKLADLREEVAYLKVKLRREGSVTRVEYVDVRDKLETLRIRAGADRVTAQPVLGPLDDKGPAGAVPVGTELDVRLQTSINSRTAKAEMRFEAMTFVDLRIQGDLVIPAGTVVRGFVSSVTPSARSERRASLTLSFDEIAFDKEHQKLRASVTQALDGHVSEDTSRIGVGPVMGGNVGGLLGGKGALVGVFVGGGGTITSTEGSDVDLPVGTILRIRVDQPIVWNR